MGIIPLGCSIIRNPNIFNEGVFRILAKAKEKIIKKLYTITDNIDIWVQEKFSINAKQKSLEWRQDNIPHKLGDKRVSEALGIKRPQKKGKKNK